MRKEFVEVATQDEAFEACPWASEVREAVGGFWAFESSTDAEIWDNQQ